VFTNEPIVASRSTFGPVIPCVAWNFNSASYERIGKFLNTYFVLKDSLYVRSEYIIRDAISAMSCNRREFHVTR